MELVVGENTYITLDECTSLLRDYFGSSSPKIASFTNLSTDMRKACIYRSFLDMERLQYRGKKVAYGQVLSFPRVNRLGYSSDENKVKLAQALNVLAFSDETSSGYSMDDVLKLGSYGITKYKLGSFAVDLNGNKLNETLSTKSKSGYIEIILPEWLRGGVGIV